MSWEFHFVIGILLLISLMSVRIPVGVALLLAGIVGITLTESLDLAVRALQQILFSTTNSWLLVAIPLFILLAEILVDGGVSRRGYGAFATLFRGLPAALPVATIGMGGLLGAVSGSSAANVASLGRISIDEMRGRGYPDHVAVGAVSAAGGLGIIIPPSIPMIIYGFINDVSVPRLFLAGIVPGLFLLVGAAIVSMFASRSVPPEMSDDTDAAGVATRVGVRERLRALLTLTPLLSIVVAVLGSIYLGIATPTEAAVIGVVAGGALVLLSREWRRGLLGRALHATMISSGFILLIVVGAQVFAFYWNLVAVPAELSTFVSGLDVSPILIYAGCLLLVLVLGMFMDSIALILVITPIVAPLLVGIGIDPIVVAVLLLVMIEVGMNTPPVGFSLFIIAGVTRDMGVRYASIVRGAAMFLIPEVLLVLVLPLVPALALWLAYL